MRTLLAALSVVCSQAPTAHADVLETGIYGSVGLSYSAGSADWEANNGTSLPNIGGNATAINLRFGYQWDLGAAGALSIESAAISNLMRNGSPKDCTTGNRARECTASISEALALGARYGYALSDSSAILVRGGIVQADVVTARGRSGRTPNLTERNTNGAYLGLGYMYSYVEDAKLVLDITHYDFGTHGHIRNDGNLRKSISAVATSFSLGIEFSF